MMAFRKYGFIISLLVTGSLAQAQKHQFNGRFAPSEPWTSEQEKPYRQNLCLNGTWQFEPVALPPGFKEGVDPAPELPAFSADDVSKTPIRIPSPWNVNSFADKNGQAGDFITFPSYPKSWESVKMGWLSKKVNVPASWKGKHVSLHFEAVAGDAQILVNGKLVGHNFDIFLPFDIDVTAYLHYGQDNEITVGVRKASLFDHRGEHGRRTYQAGSFWGQHIAGIWQDVELVATPLNYIQDVYVRPQVDEGKLITEVRIRNTSASELRVQLAGDVYEWRNLASKTVQDAASPAGQLSPNAALSIASKEVVIPAGTEKTLNLEALAGNKLKLWSMASPNLYGLVIKEIVNGKTVDRKYTRFGWRQTKIEGSKFLLNGKPVVLKGDSWHFMGIPQMTRRYAWAWFTALKAANLNAVRLHAEPYPRFYLDMADEMGIMVLDESAMWASDGGPKFDDPAYWKDSENHMARLVLRDRNHPAIFGWSISNEIMPVIRNVMHNPPGLADQLIAHYSIWADTCRKLDPSRPWISADGEDDGDGRLPVYVVHYGGFQSMDRGQKSGKPWGVGEAGNAYYGTPEQVATTNGDRAYQSFLGRMEGVAISSYQSLVAQRQRNASYRSVFNLAWYGLKPLNLGMHDTTRAPNLDDGIFFTQYTEGVEGVQPERLGPYTTTFNPGYDPALPLYETWPLFEAIRDASADTLAVSRWAKVPEIRSKRPANTAHDTPFQIMGGAGSELENQLRSVGLQTTLQNTTKPQILILDGKNLPDKSTAGQINQVLTRGGRVIVWGVSNSSVKHLNALLPKPITLTNRTSSSLVIKNDDDILNGVGLADLYFSEQSPAEVVTQGLSGPFVESGDILLQSCNTDWLRWNKQPEYAKTAMILRSEREAKPQGAVLVRSRTNGGEWLITTFPADSRLLKVQLAIRKILFNLGLPLAEDNAAAAAINKGKVVHTLTAGPLYPPSGNQSTGNPVDFNRAAGIKSETLIDGQSWTSAFSKNGLFNFGTQKRVGDKDEVVYMSFWISSPRSLEDLLLEPNLPTVNLEVSSNGMAQVWLNGTIVLQSKTADGNTESNAVSSPLKFKQGWNHVFIKLTRKSDNWAFNGRFTSNQPAFIEQLQSSVEKP